MERKEDYYFWIMFLIAMHNTELNVASTTNQETIFENLDIIIRKLDSLESKINQLTLNE